MWQTKKYSARCLYPTMPRRNPPCMDIEVFTELGSKRCKNYSWICYWISTWHVPPQCWSYRWPNHEFQNAMFTFAFPSMLPPSAGASASVETESCDAARAREDSGRKRGLPPCRWELQQLVRTGWVWQKLARNQSSAKWPNMWVEQTCLNMCILLTQTDKCTYDKTCFYAKIQTNLKSKCKTVISQISKHQKTEIQHHCVTSFTKALIQSTLVTLHARSHKLRQTSWRMLRAQFRQNLTCGGPHEGS